jgi:hypothetical protein
MFVRNADPLYTIAGQAEMQRNSAIMKIAPPVTNAASPTRTCSTTPVMRASRVTV